MGYSILTDQEKLFTRCLIANAVEIPPDNVRIIGGSSERHPVLFALDNYRGFNLVLGFGEVPTLQEAKQKVQELYLAGAEWEKEST